MWSLDSVFHVSTVSSCGSSSAQPAHHLHLEQQPEPVPPVLAHHGRVVLLAATSLALDGDVGLPARSPVSRCRAYDPVHPWPRAACAARTPDPLRREDLVLDVEVVGRGVVDRGGISASASSWSSGVAPRGGRARSRGVRQRLVVQPVPSARSTLARSAAGDRVASARSRAARRTPSSPDVPAVDAAVVSPSGPRPVGGTRGSRCRGPRRRWSGCTSTPSQARWRLSYVDGRTHPYAPSRRPPRPGTPTGSPSQPCCISPWTFPSVFGCAHGCSNVRTASRRRYGLRRTASASSHVTSRMSIGRG